MEGNEQKRGRGKRVARAHGGAHRRAKGSNLALCLSCGARGIVVGYPIGSRLGKQRSKAPSEIAVGVGSLIGNPPPSAHAQAYPTHTRISPVLKLTVRALSRIPKQVAKQAAEDPK